ncbi:MAG: FGGY family carbohydrate kinase [Thermoplasmataceae archaeon]
MMEKVILSIDVGTTNVKASTWTQDGAIVTSSSARLSIIHNKGAMVEQDPYELWDSIISTAYETIDKARARRDNILGIGIANQRESVLAWDSTTLKPVTNIISWQDRRTIGEIAIIREKFRNEIEERSGLVVDPYFSAPKIKWILENVEEAHYLSGKGLLRTGTVDSWVLSKFTMGRSYFTDHTNASRTMLMNLRKGKWDEELLSIFSIPEDILPEIRPSSSDYGEVLLEGPMKGKEILSVVGDQQSSIIGMGRIKPGETKVTVGTGTFMVSSSGKDLRTRKGLLSTCLYSDESGYGNYALEGSSFFSGALLDYMKKNIFGDLDVESIDPFPKSFNPGSNVYFVPALAGLGSPFWDPGATGTIIGIRPDTDWKDISSSALQSIAFRINDMISAMDQGDLNGEMWVDGGVSKNTKMMQFISDITRLKIQQTQNPDHITGRGAANLAFRTIDHHELTDWAISEASNTFTPSLPEGKTMRLYAGWIKALERSGKWDGDR